MVSLRSLNLYFSPERGGVYFHMFKSNFNFFYGGKNFPILLPFFHGAIALLFSM